MASLLLTLRAEFSRAGDPKKAIWMQAYTKSEMPYHGVPAPGTRAICKRVFENCVFPNEQAFTRAVLAIWRGAKFREERYGAIALSGHGSARSFQTKTILPMYEEMITDGAWWDFVDVIATDRVGDLLRNEPRAMKRTLGVWSRSDDMWKRRTSILSQIRFKEDTDLEFLYACIEPSIASKEFFLRKAIGWALRQYAWTSPREVRRYVKANEARLSPLSRREALKNCGP